MSRRTKDLLVTREQLGDKREANRTASPAERREEPARRASRAARAAPQKVRWRSGCSNAERAGVLSRREGSVVGRLLSAALSPEGMLLAAQTAVRAQFKLQRRTRSSPRGERRPFADSANCCSEHLMHSVASSVIPSPSQWVSCPTSWSSPRPGRKDMRGVLRLPRAVMQRGVSKTSLMRESCIAILPGKPGLADVEGGRTCSLNRLMSACSYMRDRIAAAKREPVVWNKQMRCRHEPSGRSEMASTGTCTSSPRITSARMASAAIVCRVNSMIEAESSVRVFAPRVALASGESGKRKYASALKTQRHEK
mmetsp:Transcript_41605/g.121598  ORF Transcript_41605/g.121598 Transcript_41605/m.121598 type:complete len:310 (-) Transcript_41605:412-1341(-)